MQLGLGMAGPVPAVAQIVGPAGDDSRRNIAGPNFPADPDVPCEKMMNPATTGPVQRTYIKTWD